MNKIGLIGYGTVGQSFYKQIQHVPNAQIDWVALKSTQKQRLGLHDVNLTYHAIEICHRPDLDIIVEAIDDINAALEYAEATLKTGKVYVTANKKMVAENLHELLRLEELFGGKLYLEACVAGAIPILDLLENHFRHEKIRSIRGIVNGSCNYILSSMRELEISFETALKQAQDLGFAETDYSSDVDGFDAAYKACILTHLAFGKTIQTHEVNRKGIGHINAEDIKLAQERGLKIKSVMNISSDEHGAEVMIGPELIRSNDPLFNVEYEQNALVIEGEHSGPILIQGSGAGGDPTASAMIGDVGKAIEWLNSGVLKEYRV